MSEGSAKTLILNRKNGDLWVDTDEGYITVLYGITGVQHESGNFNPVILLRGGDLVGIVWDIKEIKERW